MNLVSRYTLALVVSGALMLPAMAQTSSGGTSTGVGSSAQSDTGSKKGKQSSGKASEMSTGSAAVLPRTDRLFMEKAAAGGLLEVQLGQLATQKAADPSVKQFGQRMVDDHTKANDQLKSIAQQKGVNPPDKLPAKDQATVVKLSKLSGAEFDKAYMKDMVADHKHDVSEFQKEANSSKDNDIKNFASQTVPTLQDHLKQAEQINGTVNGAKASADHAGKKKGKKSAAESGAGPS